MMILLRAQGSGVNQGGDDKSLTLDRDGDTETTGDVETLVS